MLIHVPPYQTSIVNKTKNENTVCDVSNVHCYRVQSTQMGKLYETFGWFIDTEKTDTLYDYQIVKLFLNASLNTFVSEKMKEWSSVFFAVAIVLAHEYLEHEATLTKSETKNEMNLKYARECVKQLGNSATRIDKCIQSLKCAKDFHEFAKHQSDLMIMGFMFSREEIEKTVSLKEQKNSKMMQMAHKTIKKIEEAALLRAVEQIICSPQSKAFYAVTTSETLVCNSCGEDFMSIAYTKSAQPCASCHQPLCARCVECCKTCMIQNLQQIEAENSKLKDSVEKTMQDLDAALVNSACLKSRVIALEKSESEKCDALSSVNIELEQAQNELKKSKMKLVKAKKKYASVGCQATPCMPGCASQETQTQAEVEKEPDVDVSIDSIVLASELKSMELSYKEKLNEQSCNRSMTAVWQSKYEYVSGQRDTLEKLYKEVMEQISKQLAISSLC